MLSGIGPKETLSSLEINTIVNLPSVGQNLTDHPLVQNHFLVNSAETFDEVLRNQTLFKQTFEQWNTTHQGLFTNPSGGTLGFLRLPSNSSILSDFGDPSSGPHSAHIELIFVASLLSPTSFSSYLKDSLECVWPCGCPCPSNWQLYNHNHSCGFTAISCVLPPLSSLEL